MRLILLHSPLVGPGTWNALAPLLRMRGHEVIVPDYAGAMQGEGPYYPIVIETVRAALRGLAAMQSVFVAHSGAGAILPSVAADGCAIFMDALLPCPGRCWFDTAPETLKAHLLKLARDGRVPPWHAWWPKGAIEAMLGEHHDGFVARSQDLPLAYFAELAPVVADLAANRCVYLQLSAGYTEADTAEAYGWITRRLALHHLAMLTHPHEVCSALDEILPRLGSL